MTTTSSVERDISANRIATESKRISDAFRLHVNGSALLLTTLLIINVFSIVVINVASLTSFFYFLLLSSIIIKFFLPLSLYRITYDYALFSILAIVLYLLQYWASPQFIGLSGGFGIGTDDTRYFYYIADSYPSGFDYTSDLRHMREYERIMKFVAWFPINHPLDILFFNIAPIILIAPFTQNVAYFFLKDEEAANLSARLIRFCPFLLANSLILVRDGWITMAIIGGIYFLVRANYLKFGLMLVILLVLRMGSALLFITLVLILVLRLYMWRETAKTRFTYLFTITLILFTGLTLLAPAAYTYLNQKGFLASFFFRSYFVSGFLTRAAIETGNEGSILLAIYREPAYLRIPLGFTYFFMSPLFTPNQIIRMGIIAPRAILQNLFALLFIFYLRYFVRGCVQAVRHRNWDAICLLLSYVVIIFIISQGSIQIRHKVSSLPFLYIMVAYGWRQRNHLGDRIGVAASISSFTVQVGRALLRLI